MIEKYNNKVFDKIKHIDADGNEFWYARELQKVLEYSTWQKFKLLITKAGNNCANSNISLDEQLNQEVKLSKRNNGAMVEIIDYKLSRYICYLIVLNADPNKKIIAMAKTYFAIQTRKMELLENETLTEEERRLEQRELTKKGNYLLNQAASNAGVRNFAKFHNEGYKGLYNGETANDIAIRKKLKYREDILDNMGSDELIANLFRISQTEQKIRNDNISNAIAAYNTHYKVGKEIRNTIKKLGGTMPEKLPTPRRSLKLMGKNNNHLTHE